MEPLKSLKEAHFVRLCSGLRTVEECKGAEIADKHACGGGDVPATWRRLLLNCSSGLRLQVREGGQRLCPVQAD